MPFAIVAKEQRFARAAAKLGVSPSALGRMVRNLEERLGLRLFTCSTRAVSSTAAGERPLRTVARRFEIEEELAALSELRDKPAGTIRITAGEHPAIAVLQPALRRLLTDHPDVKVEIVVDHGLTDSVTKGYDAGVRIGESGRQGHDRSESGQTSAWPWLALRPISRRTLSRRRPNILHRTTASTCDFPTCGGLFAWEFEKNGHELKVRVKGQTVVNNIGHRLNSALVGLAHMPEDQAVG